MKKKDPALWAALRIHRILCPAQIRVRANSVLPVAALLSEQRSLERCWRMFEKAQARGWTQCIAILQKRLRMQVAEVHEASRRIPPGDLTQPAVNDIFEEIRYLHDEFDEVEIDKKEKQIVVTTDPIRLEDVRLGAFCIHLPFDRLARRRDASAFVIVAEDDNPSAGDSACTHPHVRDETLCAGEATAPISHALAEGRIGDAFQLVNRVLHTYNGSSAYVSLEDWDGQSCGDCGSTTSSDSLYHCEHCNTDFCDECMRTCDRCEKSVCFNCSEENDNGDRLCPDCKILDDQEREDAHEEEETPVSDDSIHDPTEEEPQPPTETIHEPTHCNSPETQLPGIELPGSPPDGEGRAVSVDTPAPQAA